MSEPKENKVKAFQGWMEMLAAVKAKGYKDEETDLSEAPSEMQVQIIRNLRYGDKATMFGLTVYYDGWNEYTAYFNDTIVATFTHDEIEKNLTTLKRAYAGYIKYKFI